MELHNFFRAFGKDFVIYTYLGLTHIGLYMIVASTTVGLNDVTNYYYA